MPNFDLNNYETVDSRIKRFYSDHPNGSITTDLVDWSGEIGQTRWVVKASVWRDRVLVEGEPGLMAVCPDGTGYAFEVDGAGMAQKTAALETAETSAIGRALANIGYSGDKRASREEMSKTQTSAAEVDHVAVAEWLTTIEGITSEAKLKDAWTQIGAAGLGTEPRLIRATNERKKVLGAQNPG